MFNLRRCYVEICSPLSNNVPGAVSSVGGVVNGYVSLN